MKEIIRSLPEQILKTIKESEEWKIVKKRFHRIIVCGMGGSGIGGEIASALYPEIEIIVNKDYNIPAYIDKKTLAILVSYSGNTEETLKNYEIIQKKKVPIVIISSDGELIKNNALKKIKIPEGLPPRGALGYLFTPIPIILYRAGLIAENPLNALNNLALFLKQENKNLERMGKFLSEKVSKRLPLIYANSPPFGIVANRWRCQLNENSKILCHTNIIPEMNHNEIVGLGMPQDLNKNLIVIFLNDPNAHPRNKTRVEITKEIIKMEIPEIEVIEIKPSGKNNLERVFWTIMLGDFLSFYLAIKNGIDPMPVKRIDYLKGRLKQLKE